MIQMMLARLAGCILCAGLVAALVSSADAGRETAARNPAISVVAQR